MLFKYFNIFKGNINFKHQNEIVNIPDGLAKFYFIYQKYYRKYDHHFFLPEGISIIKNIALINDGNYLKNTSLLNAGNYIIDTEIDSSLVRYIKNNAQNKILAMPSSLRKIEGEIGIPLRDVLLFEGLTTLKGNVFANQDFDSLIFPATIKEISENAFNTQKLQEIIIKEDALIENGEEYLQEILKCFPLIEKYDAKSKHKCNSFKLGLRTIKVSLNDDRFLEYKIEDFIDDNTYPKEYAKLNYSKKNLCIHYIYEDLMKKIKGRVRKR